MLRKIRVALACLFFVGICLLFWDVSGILPQKLAFLAKIQLVPAILAGSIVSVAALLIGTFLFGRVYCSIICPMGVFQDVVSWLRRKRRRFRFSASKTALRWVALFFFVAAFILGVPLLFGIMEPYSAFGRIATGLFAPIWTVANNGAAYLSEQAGSFYFAAVPVWIKGISAFVLAILTLFVIAALAWRDGRTWCNTICPVGTALGVLSRFAVFRPRFALDNCIGCGLCERSCKASCIDSKSKTIDASRCVSCFNCLTACNRNALHYSPRKAESPSQMEPGTPEMARRGFLLAVLGAVSVPTIASASELVDDDIPALARKNRSPRTTPVLPPGVGGLRSFSARCTGCQLCISACPNQVLSSSDNGLGMLQPSLSFERGYCRVNCVECSNVCPVGAILPLTVEAKSAIQIGRAVVDRALCIRQTDAVECTTCSRNCPTGAIVLIEKPDGQKDIAVDHERCIGCGACEYYCPARPFSAIHVEGNSEQHRV